MNSPSIVVGKPARAVKARDGRVHKAAVYRPQYALGILCESEAEQQSLHARLSGLIAGREIKVLVI